MKTPYCLRDTKIFWPIWIWIHFRSSAGDDSWSQRIFGQRYCPSNYLGVDYTTTYFRRVALVGSFLLDFLLAGNSQTVGNLEVIQKTGFWEALDSKFLIQGRQDRVFGNRNKNGM
jgi:hypothetical protein